VSAQRDSSEVSAVKEGGKLLKREVSAERCQRDSLEVSAGKRDLKGECSKGQLRGERCQRGRSAVKEGGER
jgi:hypothetical protein